MKIRGSVYARSVRYKTKTEPDPEELAFEQRQAEHRANIERLKAELAERQNTLVALEQKRHALGPPKRLCFLPSYCGNDFAEAIFAGECERIDLAEAWEKVLERQEIWRRDGADCLWLDRDHDCATRMFEIWRFYYAPNEGIFCEGKFTPIGCRLLERFNGVSPMWLEYSKRFPPSNTLVMARSRFGAERAKTLRPINPMGVMGSICINDEPTFRETKHQQT
jgi:hypothetical protein